MSGAEEGKRTVERMLISCRTGAEARRCLGWVVPEAGTGLPEWLPAEIFGPLPVAEP